MKKNRINAWMPKAWLCAAAVLATGACVDLDIVNNNAPDRDRAITSPTDIQALISGSYQSWEPMVTHRDPSSAMTVVADAASSSWGNFGMRDAGSEPRVAYNNDPSYGSSGVNANPWNLGYQSLAALRDGLVAVEANRPAMVAELGEMNTERVEVFGKLMQGLTLAALAVIFDQAFIVDEETELTELELSDYNAVWAAADAKLREAEQLAQGAAWNIPSLWVGCNGDWSGARTAEIARAYRARYSIQVPRTPEERESLDWAAIKAAASPGLSEAHGGYYDTCIWGWHGNKWPLLMLPGWGRTDIRTIGPADASGKWEAWINADLNDRTPFDIVTDDRRITGFAPDVDGMYMEYIGSSPFPADRGVYHYSNYRDMRFDYIYLENTFIGLWPDMIAKELEFIAAEADYRLGNMAATMETVNKYRVEHGQLPPFRSVGDVAPGGSRCVPQMEDGSCGDLWEAYKYEKRIEVYGYAMGVEYFDDRGWGDLVQYSWTQLPIPGAELEVLLMDIYTFGGPGGNSSAPYLGVSNNIKELFGQTTPEGLRLKRQILDARLQQINSETPNGLPIRK